MFTAMQNKYKDIKIKTKTSNRLVYPVFRTATLANLVTLSLACGEASDYIVTRVMPD